MFRLTGILIILFLFSCGRKADDSGKTVFRYNESNGIVTLDPAFARDQSIIWPCMQIYEGLVQLDEKLNVVPCIARSWEITDSGKVYTFHLRDDVYFHKHHLFKTPDSTRTVKAFDIAYSLNRLADPKIASPGAWVLGRVARKPDGSLDIETAGDSTVIIRLSGSYPPFLGLLTMPYCSVVPREVAGYYRNDFRSHPCGTGPFRFSFWKENVKLILLKNESYFGTDENGRQPHLDAVDISFISDKQSAFIEFLKGRLDFISGLDASYKDDLLTRTGKLREKYTNRFRMETMPYLNTEYLGIYMDTTSELMRENPLRIRDLRKALSMGIDRQNMIRYLRNNLGTPGEYGMIPPGLPAFDSTEVYGYRFDREQASALVKKATGGMRPGITISTTSNYLDLTEFIRSEWQSIGFDVKIDVNQAAVHRKMVSEQKLAFFRGSWIADYPDAENYLSLFYSQNFAPGGPNYTHFSNKEFDRMFDEASAEQNDSLRYILYRKMDRLIMEEAPVIILYYDKVLRLFRNDITGLRANAMNLLMLKSVRKINPS